MRDSFDVGSTPVSSTVNITAINDAPTAAIGPMSYNATEQVTLDLKGTGLALSDPDLGPASVTATLSVGAGTLTVTAGTSGVAVSNSGTANVSLTGTLAQINALLSSDLTSGISYINASDAPVSAPR